MSMTDIFRDLIPHIEGRLFAWGESLRAERPNAPISMLYTLLDEHGPVTPAKRKHVNPSSPQERWAINNHDMLHNAAVIKRALMKMPSLDRRVVFLRYAANMTWADVAHATGQSESRVKGTIKERALYLVASEFEMLSEEAG